MSPYTHTHMQRLCLYLQKGHVGLREREREREKKEEVNRQRKEISQLMPWHTPD